MKRWIFLISLGVAGAIGLRMYAFEGIYIASDSMVPTLNKGDHVFVNKIKPRFRGYRRGDIVLLETPQAPDKGYVKRIIAIPGDTIQIVKKKVYLNGRYLSEPYIQHLRPNDILSGDNTIPLFIPKGHVFVMGDNRDFSRDSRDWEAEDGTWLPYVPVSGLKGLVRLP